VSIATGWSEPVPGRDSSPAEVQRLFTAHFLVTYLLECLQPTTTKTNSRGQLKLCVIAFGAHFGRGEAQMKHVLLFASISVASGLLFANLYTSLVDAKSWGSDIPTSIETAREYFKTVTPANFFRIFSPVNQILALTVLILFWKSGLHIRMSLGAALAMYILVDVFTFAYFYPRNDIMFKTAQLTDTTSLRAAWSSWSAMNWVRSLILFAGLIFSFLSLHKIYSLSEN
jgi:hypothetical protein